jgi:hypothetical protein
LHEAIGFEAIQRRVEIVRVANRGRPYDYLAYSIALDFFHHNFVRIHQTLRMTPAMKAGIAQYPMSIEDLVSMLPLPVAKKRGKYKPRLKQA